MTFAQLKSQSAKNNLKYAGPKNQCDIIKDEMVGHDKLFFDFAKHDEIDTELFQGLGYYKCYCEKVVKITAYFKKESDKTDQEKYCNNYFFEKFEALFLTNIVTVLVSVINFILKTVNIKSVQFIGLFTEGN